MTDQTQPIEVPTAPKPRWRDRFKRNDSSDAVDTSPSFKERAKNVMAVVGVVSVVGAVAAVVAQKTAKDTVEEVDGNVELSE